MCRLAAVRAFVVVNAAPPVGTMAEQARRAMVERGAAVAPVVLYQWIAHMHAFTRGQTAPECEASGKAAAELLELYRWTVGQGRAE